MKVLIYDGNCNMCSNFIKFVVKVNRNNDVFITDFNSQWCKENINIQGTESILYKRENEYYSKSTAVLNMLADLNIFLKPVKCFKLVPTLLRDIIYDFISKNRNKMNKYLRCSLPSQKYLNMYLK